MKCPTCRTREATNHPVYGILPCNECRDRQSQITPGRNPEFINLSRKERIEPQRDKYMKDILQPWDGNKPNKDFIKAYPKQTGNYYSKDELRKSDV